MYVYMFVVIYIYIYIDIYMYTQQAGASDTKHHCLQLRPRAERNRVCSSAPWCCLLLLLLLTVEQAKVTGCIGTQAGEGEGIDQVVFAFLDIPSVSFSSSSNALLQFAHQNLPQ